MKLKNSKLYEHIIESHKVNLGHLYFFKDIVVVEFNEGVHIDFDVSQEHIELIIDFFGYERPFGYICNRVNDYSVSPLDYPKFNSALKNLAMYGIVNNNHFDPINYNIEKRFCNKPYKDYNDIYVAFNQVSMFLNKTKAESMENYNLNKSQNYLNNNSKLLAS